MAIIRCPKCGREISDKGTVCPTCLTPMTEILALQKKQKPKKSLGCAVCLFAVLAGIGAFVVLAIASTFLLNRLGQTTPDSEAQADAWRARTESAAADCRSPAFGSRAQPVIFWTIGD